MEPYEIIAAPLTLWLAPVGEAYPLVDADPSGNWFKVGTNGDRNYDEDGVTVAHSQSINTWRGAGATGPQKAFRPEEDLMVRVPLVDLSLEQYAKVLNDNSVSTTAAGVGTAGFKSLGLSHGKNITLYSLLARGVSPYDASMALQYEVPRCYQSGNPEPNHRKDQPAGLDIEFAALEDLTASSEDERFGRLIAQHQAPLP